jgi:hypothetical protein
MDIWEYDPARGVVMLTFQLGSAAPVDLDVRVSTPGRGHYGAFHMKREDETTWVIEPHRFGSLSLAPHPIHDALGTASIRLLDAPQHISDELEKA